MSTIPELTWKESGLPPFGRLPTIAVPSESAPDDWLDEATYKPWLADMLELFSRVLWPVCDVQNELWRGDAVETMERLTVADLGLLRQIRQPRARLIALGRTFSGIHYRTDGLEGILLGERVAVRMLQDLVETLPEDFSGYSFTSFRGARITIEKSRR